MPKKIDTMKSSTDKKNMFDRPVIINQFFHKGFSSKHLVRNGVKISLKEYSIKPLKRDEETLGLY